MDIADHRKSFYSLVGSLVAWLIAAGLYMLVRFCGTGDTITWVEEPYEMVAIWILGACILGVLDWLATAAINGSELRSRPFGYLIVLRVTVLVLGFLSIILVSRCVEAATGKTGIGDILPEFWDRVFDPHMIAAMLYLIMAAALVTFVKQTSALVGGRILINLATGKYHRPKAEERIFMFLDLRSSTGHAERLGNEKYCMLVQDCFRDLTDAAIRHQVEIHKYVGDEAILTWKIEEGLRQGNCLEVFFAFAATIEKRRAYYEETYGTFPEFKAGANVGTVTVLEIGVIKREIAYLSEVLNTAARIEGLCNHYGQDLIISNHLCELVSAAAGSAGRYKFERLGSIDLRGRTEAVDLFGVAQMLA